MSFIGIAINIWVDMLGTGGAPPPPGPTTILYDRAVSGIQDRAGDQLLTRVASN